MEEKEGTIQVSFRVNKKIKKAMVDFCSKEKLIIQGFLEDAIIRELEARRTGKK